MLNIKRIFETIADAGQKILEKKSKKKSVATKKKFRGARSAAAGQTAGQIIRRERLMI